MTSTQQLFLLFTIVMIILLFYQIYSKNNKLTFVYISVIVLMSFFIGLRNWCNDTGTYREIYELLTPGDWKLFYNLSLRIGDSPLFLLINRILKSLGVTTQGFLMFYSIITIFLYMWFIKKYSSNMVFSIFLLWTMGIYLFAAAGIRQALAIGIGLIGVDRFLNRKYIPFVIWIILGTFVHPYVALFLFAPLLTVKPWSGRTYFVIAISFVVGIFLQQFIDIILSFTDSIGKNYDDYAFSGAGVNIFRLLVTWAPIILSFIYRKNIQIADKSDCLFFNFSVINAAIMFIALFGTANYFARLANYFLIFQTLSLPWVISKINLKDGTLIKFSVYGLFFLYFVVANVVMTPFDSYFNKMSLFEYIQIILNK